MPEVICESDPKEEESVDQVEDSLEEEGGAVLRKPTSTGSRLWERVRSSLLRPKVKIRKAELH